MEATMIEIPTPNVLDGLLSEAQKLSVYEKLVLARILLQEALHEPEILLLKPNTIIESYTPYEIEGITDDLIAKLDAAPQPVAAEHAS